MDLETALAQPSFVGLAKIVAERTSPIVSWIGAGLSASAGIPGWLALRGQVHQAAIHKANTLDDSARMLSTLTSIATIRDPWIAFERLHEILGATTFAAEIRRALDTSGKGLPEAYRLLLRLPLRGILSLNIDSFCNDAVNRIETPRWKTFTGRDAPRMTHLLQQRQPFAVQLHGAYDDQTSWVFRRSELEGLLKNAGYVNFVRSLLSTHTLVFIGVSVDDVASGGLLEQLVSLGVNAGSHYWITNRSDSASDKWAEKIGIQIIRYNPEHGHRMMLQLLAHLTSYVSLDEPVVPVAAPAFPSSLIPQDELISRSVDEIRGVLNVAMSGFHADEPAKLKAFYRAYRKCISVAWIVDVEDSYNTFFGRKIEKEIGEGAFGSVYLAKNPIGDYEAVKVLHQDVYNDPDMLNSFRRGVRSMRFLTTENIPGVVRSVEAYEMPPSVVMEYVPGLTLLEAVGQRQLSDWSARLEVAAKLALIVRAAHQSVHRVLHRDLRPHNIMLKNYFSHDDEIELVVLDFDLSWHRDSVERSIYPRVEGALGYAAPEQFASGAKSRTRSALVDCFGLGMTMLYLAIERHPQPHEQDSARWPEMLRQEVAMQQNVEWHSLPGRFARLIRDLTQSEQELRVDFALATLELNRMRSTLASDAISASVIAEEVMHRVAHGIDYTWNSDEDKATTYMSGGVFSIQADEVDGKVIASFTWSDNGDRDRRKLSQQLRAISEYAERRLREAGWASFRNFVSGESLELQFEADASLLRARLERAVEGLQQVKAKFAF